MTDYIVSSGVTSSGIGMVPGDTMMVAGVALSTTDVGDRATVMSGGVMGRTTLEAGAILVIQSGGVAISGSTDSTSEVTIQEGGSLSNFTVSGLLDQEGDASQVVIASGGVDRLDNVAVSGLVAAGGKQEVFEFGHDEFGAVAGVQLILGGEAFHDTILGGGVQDVDADGVAEVDTVDSGAAVVVSRFGILTGSVVQSGGTVTLVGQAFSNNIAGSMTVLAGGVDLGSEIRSGGSEVVSSGGESETDPIDAGAALFVLAGGLASRTSLGGEEVIGSGGVDLSASIDSGGLQLVSGGTASSGSVMAGGRLQVKAGGVAFSATVSSGGRLIVSAGGLANETDLRSGASVVILSGATATNGIQESGSTEVVSRGGQDEFATVAGVLTVRGSATGDEALQGGQLVVLGGGLLASSIIGFDGEDLISNGGKADATDVAGSGTEVVLSGGVASGTTVFGGGQEIVASGGLATLLKVSSGGSASVEAGGTISGANLAAGATLIDGGQVLLANRTLLGTLSGAGRITEIASHGVLTLSENGSAFGGVAAISAGRIELAVAGAIGSGGVLFLAASTASQTLQIDAAAAPAPGGAFANTITNFSNDKKEIDLRSLAFSAGASATLSGSTLTLADGGKTYQFHLAGLLGKSFSVAADGSGGTEITAHNTAAFTQAAAVLGAPGPALQSPVSGYAGDRVSPIHAATAGGRD